MNKCKTPSHLNQKIADNIPPPSTSTTPTMFFGEAGHIKGAMTLETSPYGFCEKINKTIIAADCASFC